MNPSGSLRAGEEAQFLAEAFAGSGGENRPVVVSTPGVYATVMDAPGGSVVFLNNATGKPLDNLTVRVRNVPQGVTAESARVGRLDPQRNGDEVTVKLTLPTSDFIALRRK